MLLRRPRIEGVAEACPDEFFLGRVKPAERSSWWEAPAFMRGKERFTLVPQVRVRLLDANLG
jgi:hypothetical protein